MSSAEEKPNYIDGYNSQGVKTNPPKGAEFDKGDHTLADIQQTTDRRREHSTKLTDKSRKGWEKQSPCS